MPSLDQHVEALRAVRAVLERHGLRADRLEAWKDGSNLLVRPVPAPVIVRVATFTGRVRRDPVPYLAREVALVRWLAARGAPVMGLPGSMPPGPFTEGGFGMAAFAFVEHVPGEVPDGGATLRALDALHLALRDYPGDLPYMGPASGDLDFALAHARHRGLVTAPGVAALTRRRDELLARLRALDPGMGGLHGDAFPRNTVVARDGTVTWIDLEDACRGPVAWDLAVLVRNVDDPAIRAEAEARVGREPLEAAIALRTIQADVWRLLHDARAAGIA